MEHGVYVHILVVSTYSLRIYVPGSGVYWPRGAGYGLGMETHAKRIGCSRQQCREYATHDMPEKGSITLELRLMYKVVWHFAFLAPVWGFVTPLSWRTHLPRGSTRTVTSSASSVAQDGVTSSPDRQWALIFDCDGVILEVSMTTTPMFLFRDETRLCAVASSYGVLLCFLLIRYHSSKCLVT